MRIEAYLRDLDVHIVFTRIQDKQEIIETLMSECFHICLSNSLEKYILLAHNANITGTECFSTSFYNLSTSVGILLM